MLLAAGCVVRNLPRKMKNLLWLLPVCAMFVGCASTPVVRDAAYYQRKAENITAFTVGEVLRNNTNPDLRVTLETVAKELELVTMKDVVTINDLADIANRVPQVANSKYGFAIRAGQMILYDELETLAVNNPEKLRGVGRGMADGIRQALATRS